MITETKHRQSDLVPPVDVKRTEKGIWLELEMPGADRESISVTVTGDELSVSARKEQLAPDAHWVHRETRSGRYAREFRLSSDLARDGLEASFRDGLLRIFVPNSERLTPKRVEIRSGT